MQNMETEFLPLTEKEKEQELQVSGSQYLVEARRVALAIVDQPSFQNAADFRGKGKSCLKEITAFFSPIKKKMDEAKKIILDKEKLLSKPYAEADEIIRLAQNSYLAEQERKDKIEQERIMAEQRKRDEDARLATAVEAYKSGDTNKAESIISAPPTFQAPVNLPTVKASGSIIKKPWKAEVTEKMGLLRAIVEGRAPHGIVEVDDVELRKWVTMMGVESPCPGVRAWQEFATGARAS